MFIIYLQKLIIEFKVSKDECSFNQFFMRYYQD